MLTRGGVSVGGYRGTRFLRPFLFGRIGLSPQLGSNSVANVSKTFGGRPSDYLPYSYPRAVLVVPARANPHSGGGDRHTIDRDIHCCLRPVYGPDWLGLGIAGMGLCFGLVLLQ